jgi:hypothetical protein
MISFIILCQELDKINSVENLLERLKNIMMIYGLSQKV